VKGKEDISLIDESFTSEPTTFSLTEDSTISSTLQGKFEGFNFVSESEM